MATLFVPAIHVFRTSQQDVDAQEQAPKPGVSGFK
jgi:hypothetical protein